MRTAIVLAIVFLIAAVIIVTLPHTQGEATPTITPRVVDDQTDERMVITCCEFVVDGVTKTCAAVEGQTCERCAEICP